MATDNIGEEAEVEQEPEDIRAMGEPERITEVPVAELSEDAVSTDIDSTDTVDTGESEEAGEQEPAPVESIEAPIFPPVRPVDASMRQASSEREAPAVDSGEEDYSDLSQLSESDKEYLFGTKGITDVDEEEDMNDLVEVTEEDIMGEGGEDMSDLVDVPDADDMSDLVDVTEEDVMGRDPFLPAKKQQHRITRSGRRFVHRQPPESSLGEVRY